jgi:glycosyltransferase involved in cell wall biosynthesis
MRLIVCSSIFPNPVEPNKGIYVYKTVRAMAERADVAVLAAVPYFPKALPVAQYARYSQVPADAVVDGVRIRHPRVLVTPKIGRPLYGLSYAAGLLRPMSRLIKAGRPQALLAFWAYPDGFATVVLARLFRLPVFVGARGGDVNDVDQYFGRRRMVAWTFRHSDGALAVSRALGSAIVDLGVDPAKVKVVPNGLDDAFLSQVAGCAESGPERHAEPTVLYCGRLSAEKDPGALLEAFRILLARRPEARLVYVGDGPLRPRIEQLAAAWNIADRVEIEGEIRHDQIAGRMRRADVLCLPSLTEGYPNVLLEALACGLPIVATDVGGVSEIVTDESLGILVNPGNPDELARALDAALSRPWDRQRLRRAAQGRSWHDVARETLEFVEHTIQ